MSHNPDTVENLTCNLSDLNDMLQGRPYAYSVTIESTLGVVPHSHVSLYMHQMQGGKPTSEHLIYGDGDLRTCRAIVNALILHLQYREEIKQVAKG